MVNVMADYVDDNACSYICKSNASSTNSLKQIDLTQSNHHRHHHHQQKQPQQQQQQRQHDDADHISNTISITSEVSASFPTHFSLAKSAICYRPVWWYLIHLSHWVLLFSLSWDGLLRFTNGILWHCQSGQTLQTLQGSWRRLTPMTKRDVSIDTMSMPH